MGGWLSDRMPGELLRARGLRVTPQRRAILGAFSHGADEHLSAEEIHARAAAVVPELGRGTVYAALAELTELGLLAALGSPEPVRYETNTEPHQHFRCRLCLRLFDVALADPAFAAEGFVVEQITITAEGVCAECVDYDKGLRAGATRARRRPTPELPEGLAATTAETPVGRLTLGATPRRGDARRLRRPRRRAGPPWGDRRPSRSGAARGHLTSAKAAVAGVLRRPHAPRSARSIGSGCPARRRSAPRWPSRVLQLASYDTLDTPAGTARARPCAGRQSARDPHPLPSRHARARVCLAEYVGGSWSGRLVAASCRAKTEPATAGLGSAGPPSGASAV